MLMGVKLEFLVYVTFPIFKQYPMREEADNFFNKLEMMYQLQLPMRVYLHLYLQHF